MSQSGVLATLRFLFAKLGVGVEAVAKAKELYPDIIIPDLAMPRMDGLDAAREIHRPGGLFNIAVVAGTKRNDPRDKWVYSPAAFASGIGAGAPWIETNLSG